MALLYPTINMRTKNNTYLQNPITAQILNIFQPLYSNLSCTEILFKESTTHYVDNLRQSGYNTKQNYKPADTNHKNHSKDKRKTIWFHPLLSKNISAKNGKSFLSLLDFHFPENHIYHSIFNRNKIKVSYSCMHDIKSIINNHNMKVLNNTAETKESCNFRNENNTPPSPPLP